MAIEIPEALKKKYGPLPLYAWLVVGGGGGLIIWHHFHPSTPAAATDTGSVAAQGAPSVDPGSDGGGLDLGGGGAGTLPGDTGVLNTNVQPPDQQFVADSSGDSLGDGGPQDEPVPTSLGGGGAGGGSSNVFHTPQFGDLKVATGPLPGASTNPAIISAADTLAIQAANPTLLPGTYTVGGAKLGDVGDTLAAPTKTVQIGGSSSTPNKVTVPAPAPQLTSEHGQGGGSAPIHYYTLRKDVPSGLTVHFTTGKGYYGV